MIHWNRKKHLGEMDAWVVMVTYWVHHISKHSQLCTLDLPTVVFIGGLYMLSRLGLNQIFLFQLGLQVPATISSFVLFLSLFLPPSLPSF
jgi:hypothetical protein